jgi:hypothetical protein
MSLKIENSNVAHKLFAETNVDNITQYHIYAWSIASITGYRYNLLIDKL